MWLILYFLMMTLFARGIQAEEDEYNVVVEEAVASIAKDEIIHGNYYSIGDCSIEGTVEGNVYLLGTQITITGEIQKNLTILGGSVFLSGVVGGNVHIIAGQAIVQGRVKGDFTFIGANLLLPTSGTLEGNLFMIAGNASLEDTVKGYVTAIVASFSIAGTVQKNVRTFVDRLRLASSAKIVGNLIYRSRNQVMIDPGAQVMGSIHYRHTLLKDIQDVWFFKGAQIGSHLVHLFVKFVYTFLIGVLLIYCFPKRLQRALQVLKSRPGQSFMYGFMILLGLPIITGILLITVVGAPFALTILALNIISFYTVTVFPILWLTNKLFTKVGWKTSSIGALVVGQSIYYALTNIPIIGTIIACMAVVLGFGSAVLMQKENPK